MSISALGAVVLTTLIAALIPGLITAAIVGLVGSTASALAKVCLDSVIQHELPEASRASAFGVSETVLQLSWVFGGVVGLLLGGVWTFGHDSVYTIGFAVITVLLAVGLAQSWFVRRGRSLFPWLHYAKFTAGARRKSTPGPAPTTPAGIRRPGYPPPAGWSPGSPGLGQPPWSTGPTPSGRAADRLPRGSRTGRLPDLVITRRPPGDVGTADGLRTRARLSARRVEPCRAGECSRPDRRPDGTEAAAPGRRFPTEEDKRPVNVLRHDRTARRNAGGQRVRTLLMGAAMCLTLTACTAPLPEVTFYANRDAVNTRRPAGARSR